MKKAQNKKKVKEKSNLLKDIFRGIIVVIVAFSESIFVSFPKNVKKRWNKQDKGYKEVRVPKGYKDNKLEPEYKDLSQNGQFTKGDNNNSGGMNFFD
ncbi:MAG: hypothetical protein Q8Q35_03435 [Nanoarchaeota archaeon]|nr:hypothetical protein [Nanoarchaeota archaeon]